MKQGMNKLLQLCGAEFRGVSRPRVAILAYEQVLAQREQVGVAGDGSQCQVVEGVCMSCVYYG